MKTNKTYREEKTSSLIKRLLSPLIDEKAREIKQFITITEVIVSKDRKHCEILVSNLNNKAEETLSFLNKDVYHYQQEIKHSLQAKVIPRIKFSYDETPFFAHNIEQKLKNINEL